MSVIYAKLCKYIDSHVDFLERCPGQKCSTRYFINKNLKQPVQMVVQLLP